MRNGAQSIYISSPPSVHFDGGVADQVLANDGSGALKWSTLSFMAAGDNLGNHVATTTLSMANFPIANVSTVTTNAYFDVQSGVAGYKMNGYTILRSSDDLAGTFIGRWAGEVNTGGDNTFIGDQAGRQNNTGVGNTFIGAGVGYGVISANNIVYIGAGAGGSGAGGSGTVAIGAAAGNSNVATGSVFVGAGAGQGNTNGSDNTFIGNAAGQANDAYSGNTFVGSLAGLNSKASYNTFFGAIAGLNNSSGDENTFMGANSGKANTTGSDNTFTGTFAGWNNQTGSANAVFGYSAGGANRGSAYSFSSSTVMGSEAGSNLGDGGNDNILIGWRAGYAVDTGAGNIVIGYNKDTSAPAANNELNIGGVLYGNLSAGTIGISTRVPQAALDIVSTGTATNIYAQIWRNGSGLIVASMTSQGALYATLPPSTGGDNLGNHVATTTLNMNGQSMVNVASATFSKNVTVYSTVTILATDGSLTSELWVSSSAVTPHLYVSTTGKVGIGTSSPAEKFEVSAPGNKAYQVKPGPDYISILINGAEVYRIKP
jgi:hypothetical protein